MAAMYKHKSSVLGIGRRPKQPVEGLFCMYTHRMCMQPRLEGYEYCLKHILEDKNAPFKQCSYSSGKNSKRCTNAASKSERKEGYCLEHSRRALLIRQRSSRKKRPKETPETLLECLETSGSYTDNQLEGKRHQSLASRALEYASSSDSDAETPVVDQAWRGDGDSDAESIDSEQEDLLKHAGVYTAEEVALIMRDKLIRLQSLYIDQFKRLQHVMREKRRKYLHTVRREKDTLGGVGQYTKDVDNQENLSRFTAMKRYHRRFGTEALLHRQSKERRIAASEGTSYRPPAHSRCVHSDQGDRCLGRVLPLSKYCLLHILDDPHQVLYQQCRFPGGDCPQPVPSTHQEPYCRLHGVTEPYQQRIAEPNTDQSLTSDDIIDVTADDSKETPSYQTPASASYTCSSPAEALSGQSANQQLDPDTEQALMKKGRLLLQHLKNLDGQGRVSPSVTNGGSGSSLGRLGGISVMAPSSTTQGR